MCHKSPLKQIEHSTTYLKMPSWPAALTAVAAFPAQVKGACRAIAFLRNFCQVSCLQGQKEEMRWDKPEKVSDEVS